MRTERVVLTLLAASVLLLALCLVNCAPGPRVPAVGSLPAHGADFAAESAMQAPEDVRYCRRLDDRRRTWIFLSMSSLGLSAGMDVAAGLTLDRPSRVALVSTSAVTAALAGAASWLGLDYGNAYARDCGFPRAR